MKINFFLFPLDGKTGFLYAGLVASFFVFAFDSYNRIPLPLSQFKGNPQILRKNQMQWSPLRIGQVLAPTDRIRTDPKSKLQIDLAEDLQIQVDPDSEIWGQGPKLYEREKKYYFELEHGRIMGAFSRHSIQYKVLEIHTGVASIRTSDAVFVITKSRSGFCTIGVLKGSLWIYSPNEKFTEVRISQEKAEWSSDKPEIKTSELSLQERREMADAYLLTTRDPGIHQSQLEYSRKAGSIFQHPYFIGDFFTTGHGYTESDFFDEEGHRILDLFYDLFMPGTFGGFYMVTSDLDLKDFGSVTFEMRSKEKMAYPRSFRIEFKSGKRTVRSLAFHRIPSEWTGYAVPLKITAPVPISEIVIVFTYDGVGDAKQGGVQLRNFNLVAVGGKDKL